MDVNQVIAPKHNEI